MTPTTYGRDFAYCLKSHGGVRGFNASLWRFLLRCTLFCHSVATFLTSVSSYEGGCGFEEPYIDVVNVLGKKLGGMRREEIVSSLGVTDSGNLSRVLEDLEHSGFIIRTNSYGAKRYNAIYRLMDNFSLFYLKFMKENRTDDPEFWSHNYTSPLRYSWCGLAFERVCFQHIPQIKQALGISGVVTNTYSWQVKDDEIYGPGAQIDMLIERADNTINICEMKFSQNEFVIDKDYDANLRHKLARFGDSISRRKTLRLTMVTTYGVVHNAYWNRVQSEVVSDDLFL